LSDSTRLPALLGGADRPSAGDSATDSGQLEPSGRVVARESNGYEPGSGYPTGIYRS
jgi:hypothetical protein